MLDNHLHAGYNRRKLCVIEWVHDECRLKEFGRNWKHEWFWRVWSGRPLLLCPINDAVAFPRMSYDNGVLEMMSPKREHENIGCLIAEMIET